MQVPPAGEDDRLAKAALYAKYAEALPAAVRRWRELGVPLLLELLGGMRATVEGGAQAAPSSSSSSGTASGGGSGASSGGGGGRAYAQQLFAQAQCFVQACNVLNEEYDLVSFVLCCDDGVRLLGLACAWSSRRVPAPLASLQCTHVSVSLSAHVSPAVLRQAEAPELCCAVLDTLTALVAGSPPNRRGLE